MGLRAQEFRPLVIRRAVERLAPPLALAQLRAPDPDSERLLLGVLVSAYRVLDPRRRPDSLSRIMLGRIHPQMAEEAVQEAQVPIAGGLSFGFGLGLGSDVGAGAATGPGADAEAWLAAPQAGATGVPAEPARWDTASPQRVSAIEEAVPERFLATALGPAWEQTLHAPDLLVQSRGRQAYRRARRQVATASAASLVAVTMLAGSVLLVGTWRTTVWLRGFGEQPTVLSVATADSDAAATVPPETPATEELMAPPSVMLPGALAAIEIPTEAPTTELTFAVPPSPADSGAGASPAAPRPAVAEGDVVKHSISIVGAAGEEARAAAPGSGQTERAEQTERAAPEDQAAPGAGQAAVATAAPPEPAPSVEQASAEQSEALSEAWWLAALSLESQSKDTEHLAEPQAEPAGRVPVPTNDAPRDPRTDISGDAPSEPRGDAAGASRPPVPPQSQQAAARLSVEARVRAAEAEGSGRGGEPLRRIAAEAPRGSAERWVALMMAGQAAVLADQESNVQRAISEMTESFELTADEAKVRLANWAAGDITTESQRRRVADWVDAAVAAAVQAGKLEAANPLIAALQELGNRHRDEPIRGQARGWREVLAIAQRYAEAAERVRAAGEGGADAAAVSAEDQALAGRYWALVRRDWHRALPLLAAGSHAKLAHYAGIELLAGTALDADEATTLSAGYLSEAKRAKGWLADSYILHSHALLSAAAQGAEAAEAEELRQAAADLKAEYAGAFGDE